MSLRDLLPELMKLTRAEMVEAIKILQHEVVEDNPTQSGANTSYEVWSPQISPETGRQLLDMLLEDKEKHD